MHFLVFQHIAIEHPGSFRDFMRDDGVTWDAIEVDEGEPIPSLHGYDALMVMGGPMDVWQESEHPWLVAEKHAIREAINECNLPYLGFCLGHQLLADALGGEVGPMNLPEVGSLSVSLNDHGKHDRLFAGLPQTCSALQWHSAEVKTLPPDSVVLADSPACDIQAFRVGTTAYGIQYHCELTKDTVPEWGCVPEYETALEQTLGKGALASLRTQVERDLSKYQSEARQLFKNFATLVAESRPR